MQGVFVYLLGLFIFCLFVFFFNQWLTFKSQEFQKSNYLAFLGKPEHVTFLEPGSLLVLKMLVLRTLPQAVGARPDSRRVWHELLKEGLMSSTDLMRKD